jgi:hypothetical protein
MGKDKPYSSNKIMNKCCSHRAYKPQCIKFSLGTIICVGLAGVNEDIINLGLDF